MITSLFRKSRFREPAHYLFLAAVDQARDPVFYEKMGVPDSFDGRFDMIALHVYLVLRTLKNDNGTSGAKENQAFAQQLFDTMFRNFDDNLREMGVGDLSVAKKIRPMAEAFYGRAKAYDEALRDIENAPGDLTPLALALTRNVFGDDTEKPGLEAERLAAYAFACDAGLQEQGTAKMKSGKVMLPTPADFIATDVKAAVAT